MSRWRGAKNTTVSERELGLTGHFGRFLSRTSRKCQKMFDSFHFVRKFVPAPARKVEKSRDDFALSIITARTVYLRRIRRGSERGDGTGEVKQITPECAVSIRNHRRSTIAGRDYLQFLAHESEAGAARESSQIARPFISRRVHRSEARPDPARPGPARRPVYCANVAAKRTGTPFEILCSSPLIVICDPVPEPNSRIVTSPTTFTRQRLSA